MSENRGRCKIFNRQNFSFLVRESSRKCIKNSKKCGIIIGINCRVLFRISSYEKESGTVRRLNVRQRSRAETGLRRIARNQQLNRCFTAKLPGTYVAATTLKHFSRRDGRTIDRRLACQKVPA